MGFNYLKKGVLIIFLISLIILFIQFINPGVVDNSPGVGDDSSIALDSNGFVHIAERDYIDNNLKYCNNTNGFWTCTTVNATAGTGWHSSIAVDSSDYIHIAYYDNVTLDIGYCNNTAGSWSCATVNSTNNIGRYLSMAIDSSDYEHISYSDQTNYDLGYCNNTAGSWSCTTIDSTNDVGEYSSLAVDSSDYIHISYYDFTNKDLRYCNNTNDSWSCSAVDSTDDVGKYSSLAVDCADNIHISSYDLTNEDLRYCNNTNGSWSCTKLEDADSYDLGYPNRRNLAIKEGRVVDSTSFSDYAQISWGNNTNLYYTKVDIGGVCNNNPQINFTPPTSANNTNTTNNYFEVNASIVESNLNKLIYNIDGINYTFFNDSLVLMFNLDNRSGLGDSSVSAIDVSSNGNNGVVSGATWNSSGKYGGAFDFDGVDDSINISDDPSISPTTSITLSAWIKTNFSNVDTGVITKGAIGNNHDYEIYFFQAPSGNAVLFEIRNGSGSLDYTGGLFNGSDNSWHHYAGVFDGDVLYLYLDGVLKYSKDTALTNIRDSSDSLLLGAGWTNYFNGSIDEVRIYNRSLSSDEISQLYLSNINKFNSTQWYFYINQSNISDSSHNYQIFTEDNYGGFNSTEQRTIITDSTPPVSTPSMTSPPGGASYANDTWTASNVKITITAYDSGVGFDNTLYPKYCNDSTNTCSPNTYIGSGVTISAEGTSYIRFNSTDYLGNSETINSRTIKIDKTAPSVTIAYPTNYLNLTSNLSIALNFSVSDGGSGLDTCLYSINGGTTNTTIPSCANTTINVPEGTTTLYLYVNDSVNNLNNSESVIFTTDLTNPAISIPYPANTTYSTDVTALNYTYTEANCDSVWYSTDSGTTNSTRVNCGTNFTGLTSTEGSNTWTAYINDSTGHESSNIISFFKDSINPQISISTPTNGTNSTDTGLDVNYTYTEANCDSVWYSTDSGLTNSTRVNCGTNFTSETWSEGQNTIILYINDSLNNQNSTNVTFTIDTTPPILNIVHPVQDATYSTNSIALNFTISDASLTVDSCWYQNDSGANITIPGCTNTTINQVSDGTYTVYMWANDTLGNLATDNVSYSISTNAPAITLEHPEDNALLNHSDVEFNYTAMDDGGVDSCSLYLNSSGGWHLNSTNYHGGDTSVDVAEGNFSLNIEDGLFLWGIKCNDTGGDSNFSITNRTFRVDTIYPLISYESTTPANDTNTTNTDISVNVSVTENNLNKITFTLYDNGGPVDTTSFTDGTSEIIWSVSSGIYYYNVTANDTVGNINSTETRTIRVDNTKPSITIAEPQAQNYGDNNTIYLNHTTTDNLVGLDECWYYVRNSSGATVISTTTLSSCENTTFSLPGGDKDYTLYLFAKDLLANTQSTSRTNPNDDGTDNNFSSKNLPEGEYIWNVLCYDNFNHNGWGLNNHTYVVDLTKPLITIGSANTTGGSQTFNFNVTITDTYSSSATCKYSIYNSDGNIDGINQNVSFTCSNSVSATATSFGNFSLEVYVDDKAGNENVNYSSVNLVQSSTSGTGGYSKTIERIKVIALVPPLDFKTFFSDVQKAIIYREINKAKRLIFGTFAISLSEQDTYDLKERLQNKGITLSNEEINEWVEQFDEGNIDEVLVDKQYYEDFDLALATGTYCGDGICQENGNNLGLNEGPFNCNQDCPGADIDSATLNCIDNNPETKCVWDIIPYQYGGLFSVIIILILSFSTIENKKTRKQEPLYRYVKLKLKNRRKR